MTPRKPGYIVLLAVMIIAAMSAVVTSIINRVLVYNRLQQVLVDREQARLLALSGIQIAIAQLSAEDTPEATDKSKKEPEKKVVNKMGDELKKVLPILNRWQEFALTQEQGGVAGSCEIYLTAEQGKINLNALYDFKKKQFVKTALHPSTPLRMSEGERSTGQQPGKNQQDARKAQPEAAKQSPVDGQKIVQAAGDLFPIKGQVFAEVVGDILKQRGKPLADVTELLQDKKMQKLRDMIFVSREGKDKKSKPALLDLFTVETSSDNKNGLQPAVLSRSVGLMLQLKDLSSVDKKVIDKLIEQLKPLTGAVQWQQQWDKILSPVYGKQYNALNNDIRQLFATEFETLSFSVVSYGKFKNTLVKVYAVIKKRVQEPHEYCIKKLYWI
jgi:hypothetical protein